MSILRPENFAYTAQLRGSLVSPPTSTFHVGSSLTADELTSIFIVMSFAFPMPCCCNCPQSHSWGQQTPECLHNVEALNFKLYFISGLHHSVDYESKFRFFFTGQLRTSFLRSVVEPLLCPSLLCVKFLVHASAVHLRSISCFVWCELTARQDHFSEAIGTRHFSVLQDGWVDRSKAKIGSVDRRSDH